MRKKNLTMIVVAIVILGLVYYFMQESGCMSRSQASRVETSIETDVQTHESFDQSDVLDQADEFAPEEHLVAE
jgi:hypothetical protein